MRTLIILSSRVWLIASGVATQTRSQSDWTAVEDETIRRYQALLRLDTSHPPGNERLVVDYLAGVFLLIMSHTDVVPVDAAKWGHPPFGAVREGGYIYGRGGLDDKDNLTAALVTMLLLKRAGAPLDRDVILLAKAGEEGSTNVGIELMVNQHFSDVDAEYCLAEGNGQRRIDGSVRYATVLTAEKRGRAIELIARGRSGHGASGARRFS